MATRVVIAEDEAIIRLDLKETLEEEGYEVVGETGRGDEAVDLVKELEPDIAILDIKMPGMDGLEVLQEIRKTGSKADVIMVTAYGEVESYLKAMSLGAAEYINKPIRIKELKRIVHKVLSERKARPGV